MTNSQESDTGEVRWQSTDTGSSCSWTLGAFWQVAKEGSIEELNSTNINQLFNYLFGLTARPLWPLLLLSDDQAYPDIPACDIYYNSNTTFDRQMAGYGEVSYAFTDWRTHARRACCAHLLLNHYADGLENYGPTPQANGKETPNTPKATLAFQMDPRNLFYLSCAKGFRVGGGNAPLPPYCKPISPRPAFRTAHR